MLTALSISLVSASAIIFFSRRLLRYLRHFQEGEYSRRQFANWVIANGIYDKKGSLIATIAALALELTEESGLIFIALVICTISSCALVWLALWENDPREVRVGGFRLQPTPRATAVYNLALSLYSIVLTFTIVSTYKLGAGDDIACYWLVVIVAIQSSPIWLVLASTLTIRLRG
jgi:UDP-N-acetylmuramoyl-tripeptide--D-alanyl-D-alanine ligase